MKLLKSLKGSYDAVLVLLIVAVAGILLFAIYRAIGGGSGTKLSFAASFDDITGIKEKSKVLFKGMPVGSVGALQYEPKTDKILVRIDLQSEVEIPSNVHPYLESSLFGDSHISLRTDPVAAGNGTLASITEKHRGSLEELHRIEGVRLSRADSVLPGLDQNARKAIDAAADAMVEVKAMATVSKDMLKTVNDDMDHLVMTPVKETVDELKRLIAGPEGQQDAGLAFELKNAVTELEQSTTAMNVLFNGSKDGSKKGLIDLTQKIDGGWQDIVSTLLEGKEETVNELQKVSAALDKAGKAISRSETQIQKLGTASDKVGDAARRVDVFMEMLSLKPNAVVWGKNKEQDRMIEQRGGTVTPRSGTSGQRTAPAVPRK
ncbi:MlaD family protein [Roseimicrobium sp. ORNL1]|uniref:MlaD family protein n=1 Tax=Roseimicrobium sp. ORNL1 TaxID=2711231 RepID=UPI0013E1FDFD|nr:MlaD family protein [Roseimicrobium sp. ORNL1]QIF03360.1 MCE family protein [Roseimicrobium sp. ORNL1]